MIRLPTFESQRSDFKYKIVLNEQVYTLRLVWNIREGAWFCHINDTRQGSIQGVKVVSNWPLLKAHRAQISMTGDLLLIPRVSNPAPVGYENLADEWQLVYMSQSELETWEASQ